MMQSKFAEITDLTDSRFVEINKQLQLLNIAYGLPDHSELNKERFKNDPLICASGTYYGSRMWEYPFAILNAELTGGMKIADIGCGSTPFTPYVSKIAGPENVTGFDNDFLKGSDTHFAFGVRQKLIEDTKINFKFSELDKIDSEDSYFDRVFCISVLEHIENPAIWQKGLMEMARILKPGGRLILTFDAALTHKFLSVGDILNYTGLVPFNSIDMNWPLKRFVNVDGMAIDVFGLVLTKPSGSVFSDTSESNTMKNEDTYKKYVPDITYPNELQISKDVKRGKILTLIKLILNRYK